MQNISYQAIVDRVIDILAEFNLNAECVNDLSNFKSEEGLIRFELMEIDKNRLFVVFENSFYKDNNFEFISKISNRIINDIKEIIKLTVDGIN